MTTPQIKIQCCRWRDQQATLSQIRRDVFVAEQQVPEDLEWDGEDETAWHFIATVNQQPVAVARLLPSGQIGRMAVLRDFRQQGIATALLKQVEQFASEQGFGMLFLHAQTYISHFYEAHGFQPKGKEFMDAGIPHIEMTKLLTNNGG